MGGGGGVYGERDIEIDFKQKMKELTTERRNRYIQSDPESDSER